jgi:hypothetical protein
MAWVVDTSALMDVAEADPSFGVASAGLLDGKPANGLTVCPRPVAVLRGQRLSATVQPQGLTLRASRRTTGE